MVDLEEIVEALKGGGERIPGVESPLALRKVNYTLSSAFFLLFSLVIFQRNPLIIIRS